MVDELHEMGIRVIVSVWPSVDRKSENFEPMMEKGLLIRTERGAAQTYDFQGDCVEIDPFNPETRNYVWEVCRKNYYDYGIDAFWLDNSEPDYGVIQSCLKSSSSTSSVIKPPISVVHQGMPASPMFSPH